MSASRWRCQGQTALDRPPLPPALSKGKEPALPPSADTEPSAINDMLGRAFAARQAGQLAEAEALARQILLAAPVHAAALHLLFVNVVDVGDSGGEK